MALPDNSPEPKKAKAKKSDPRKGESGSTANAGDASRAIPALVDSRTSVLAAMGRRTEAVLRALTGAVNDARQALSTALANAADDAASGLIAASSSLVRADAEATDDLAASLIRISAKAAGYTAPTSPDDGTSHIEGDLLDFSPNELKSLQFFILNASGNELLRLIARINVLLADDRGVRIPPTESFVDSANNIISININQFWNEFDLLNSVSDAPVFPSKDSPYELLAARLDEERRAFRQHVAATILPALKEEMLLRDCATYDEKRDLVKWVNAELRRFDLTIKHPKTGNASNFVADTGNHPEAGRFQLRSEGEGGKVETFSTPKLSAMIEVLELIPAPQREEGLAKWGDRTRDSSRPARGSR